MKSKKDILDKYEQGEFINYKNGSPPKTTQDQLISNVIRSSAQTASRAEEAYKQRAIAFGEWLLNSDIVELWCEDGKWLWKSTMYDVDNKYYTTEELYNEFLKSM